MKNFWNRLHFIDFERVNMVYVFNSLVLIAGKSINFGNMGE